MEETLQPDGPVLVVDDDPLVRDLLEVRLQRAGFETVAAEDGLAGLEYLEDARTPSLIVLDLHMPGMDGREFRRHLRSRATWATIPVIILTGAADPQAVADGLNVAACLVKPEQCRFVESFARRHCRRQRPQF